MPDDIFKLLPKFDKLYFGTAKVHLCQVLLFEMILSFLDGEHCLILKTNWPHFQSLRGYGKCVKTELSRKCLKTY